VEYVEIPDDLAGIQKPDTTVYLQWVETPLGPMLCGATEHAICLLEFTDRPLLPTQMARVQKRFHCRFENIANAMTEQLRIELSEYFAKTRERFSVPLDFPGTDFQKRVWTALLDVPYGKTASYLDLAQTLGDPNAVRAVARANGDNRIAIIIPCHRIIGSDGSMTGYGGGIPRKKKLLALETGIRELTLFE
jgi:AraC family transcriptional regulator, regulatory protein of adaptative response / methylated-DNA-[protein]-cysteine methyltransferase